MFTFFSGAKATGSLPTLPACYACGAAATCRNAIQATPLKQSKIVLVVDKPQIDAEYGIQKDFPVKQAQLLGRVGIDWRDCAIVAAAACPTADEKAWNHCQPHMISEIRRLNPEKIITMGYPALQSVVRWLWGKPAEKVDRWFGQMIPSRQLNAWVLPIGRKKVKVNQETSDLWAYRHIKQASMLAGRPYDVVPDYEKQVRIIYSTEAIQQAIAIAQKAQITAFDYETTGLKPEAAGHEIVSCALAWQNHDGSQDCVGFMFSEAIKDAWVAYLQSPVKKIAANKKFEERWSRVILGTGVRNWAWDTMIAAHMEDPQKGVAGLKFQAFVNLGLAYYAGDVERFFEGKGTNDINNIHLADLQSLLRYNAIDALAELDLGIMQAYRAGISPLWSKNLPKKEHYGISN